MRGATLIVILLAALPLSAQKKTAKPKSQIATKPTMLIPLSPQERAQQLLNRFTFGPRPGDLGQVLALTPEKWFEQQLNPASIADPALDKRLNEYQTLNMQPDQALLLFPDRFTLSQFADGKRPYPTDPSQSHVRGADRQVQSRSRCKKTQLRRPARHHATHRS